ncbi:MULTISPECIES: dihydroorotate dehydrogenase [Acidiplasma]|jgi:dihydroorotate dehydrogenase (NAD+) catalytic subunit|uniref:Dihydroorotate dehydrogenase n=2 Tax=Acidiplasma TaxID=507753 RepID=A0A0Q0RG64_9ARCH|nr:MULTISPECIES: dihydroorotate dehydrogenase [Acidiplasma]KJE49123.1 dihydroorotate dehydrogenase [Acidiplasma sp. MBA-1]KPV47420.1 dihydroorotate dehydrogenase [Acidiplasma aeolicum]KQB33696.1 dihydroorotate dehydrogenase [Acidiplasma aeolicum]KQB34103.1 dihydroorotate dehydrogenase [Acidiplasma cupricumulans]WMT54943.1 MAG: dihydroorotate dehydrogenase [Acidiplasma sp.]
MNLNVDIGIKISNPFILASGILDENGYTMKRILENGAAAVVTKSIGTSERQGYNPPIIYENDPVFLNAVGLSNPGIDNFKDEVKIALESGRPVIGSIFGKDAPEFSELAKKMESYGVSAIELNLSCPHVNGYGMEVGSDPDLVYEIVSEVKSRVKIPVFSKLSPNTSNILEEAKAAEKSDALVLINTLKGMEIDIASKKPVLSNVYGGLSGKCIKPVGIRYVYEVKKETGKTVIGVGGIENVNDAIEYIMAGASAVQIGTAIYRHGIKIFNELNSGLIEYMDKNGISNINDMIGVAIA